MATLPPRRTVPDVTIEGDRIRNEEVTAEYGWLMPDGDWRGQRIIWENALHGAFNPPPGAVQIRRIRHIITERVEIVDGPEKGTRLDM